VNAAAIDVFAVRVVGACVALALLFSSTANAQTVLGKADAPVTLVEYGSLTCDYCVKFHREVLPLIISRHIDAGTVRFIYRDFPTSTAAAQGAVAARCAKDRYYEMLHTLYQSVADWVRARDVDTALADHAALLGLDEESFRDCLEDRRHQRAIEAQQREATTEYGVTGTPTFLVNDKIVAGIKDIDEMEALIVEALNAIRNPDTDLEN